MYAPINKKKFDMLLNTAVAASKKAQTLYHECGLFAVYQSIQHGNTTPAYDLVIAMPKSQRREAMILWLEHFSWVRFTKDGSGNVDGVKLHKSKTITVELLDSHMEKIQSIPYYEYSKEAVPEKPVWNFFDKLARLVKDAERHMEKGDGIVDQTDLEAVKKLAIQLGIKHSTNPDDANVVAVVQV